MYSNPDNYLFLKIIFQNQKRLLHQLISNLTYLSKPYFTLNPPPPPLTMLATLSNCSYFSIHHGLNAANPRRFRQPFC